MFYLKICCKFIGLALILLSAQASFAADPYTLVLDLDWTLINPVQSNQQTPDFISGDGEFRILPYVAESVVRLIQAGYRLVIFSGGPRERNTFAAEVILKKAKRIAEGLGLNPEKVQFQEVRSLENLTPDPSAKPEDRFRFRYDKDLLQDFPKQNQPLYSEDRVMALDDIPEFARKGQEHLFLILKPTFNNLDHWEEVEKSEVEAQYKPGSLLEWELDRGRVVWATEVFLRAKQHAEINHTPLWMEVAALVKSTQGESQLPRTDPSQLKLWQLGLNTSMKISCSGLFY